MVFKKSLRPCALDECIASALGGLTLNQLVPILLLENNE